MLIASVAIQVVVASGKAIARSSPSGSSVHASVDQAAIASSVAMPAPATCRRLRLSRRRQTALVSV